MIQFHNLSTVELDCNDMIIKCYHFILFDYFAHIFQPIYQYWKNIIIVTLTSNMSPRAN